MSHNSLVYIGQIVVFYVPIQKLLSEDYAIDGKTPEKMFEDFLMTNFNAYSVRLSDTKGFWRQHEKAQIFIDENARYEVSFDADDRVDLFVEFLSNMCFILKEEAIYLVMGSQSWLVLPKEGGNEIFRTI